MSVISILPEYARLDKAEELRLIELAKRGIQIKAKKLPYHPRHVREGDEAVLKLLASCQKILNRLVSL